MRKPTIYEALKAKLGREPTNKELCDDCKRIIANAYVDLAQQGKLSYQRR